MDALAGSKVGGYESPSRDRLIYLASCLLGHNVEVQVKNGSIYSGIFYATNSEKDFGMFFYFGFAEDCLLLLLVYGFVFY